MYNDQRNGVKWPQRDAKSLYVRHVNWIQGDIKTQNERQNDFKHKRQQQDGKYNRDTRLHKMTTEVNKTTTTTNPFSKMQYKLKAVIFCDLLEAVFIWQRYMETIFSVFTDQLLDDSKISINPCRLSVTLHSITWETVMYIHVISKRSKSKHIWCDRVMWGSYQWCRGLLVFSRETFTSIKMSFPRMSVDASAW